MGYKLRPLRFTLTSTITSLIVTVSISVLTISYFGGARSLLLLSEIMTTEVSKGITEKINNLFGSAENMGEMINLMIARGILDPKDGQSTMDMAAALVSQNEGFSSIDIALPDGSKYKASRLSDGSIMRRSDVRTNKSVKKTFYYENADFKNKEKNNEKSLDTGYDARTRPWYIKGVDAGKPVWTAMYVSGTNKEFVYSYVSPIYDKNHDLLAVAAIDLKVTSLSHFLSTLKILDHGKAFIVNEHDQAIAIPIKSTSDLDQLVKKSPEGSEEPYQLYDVEELPNHDIRTALLKYRKEPKSFFEFTGENGESIIASLVEYPYKGGLTFKIGIVFPKMDIMQNVNINTQILLSVAILLLLLAVLIGNRFSNRIAKQLGKLCDEVDKVSRLELDSNVVLASRIVEIARIDESVSNMRRGLRSFKKYVPSDLVLQLNTLKKEAVLGGEKRELTIFFSDVADFTSISEKLSPEELVKRLGVYFNGMSHIVLNNSGTLDKYIGDAIMAFWGAPLPQENHANLACISALKCQQYLDRLEKESGADSLSFFHTRIGIHTGEVIVGNIGYEERMNYTVIGDAVNLASRLEGLNKFYHTKIIISEDTFNKVRDDFVARKLDMVAVKGKTRGVLIYELVSARGDINSEKEKFLQAYDLGMDLYLNRAWAQAKRAFEEARRLSPNGTDYPSELLTARCEEFMQVEPGSDWNGVYAHESK